MALKAVFLDLGGTIMDPTSDRTAHLEMMRAFRREVGLKASPEDLLRRYEVLHEEHFQRLGTTWRQGWDIGREVVTTLLEEEGISMSGGHWEAFLEAHWREHIRWLRPFPEAGEVLLKLGRSRLHVGLLSDIDEDFLQLCLYVLPLEGHLDSITTSEEVGLAKPHEAIFRRALSKAGCEPHEAVHVGDSPEKDAAGAEGIGMTAVLIDASEEPGRADYVVPGLGEAYGVLRRLIREDTR
ncbi:MAG: HAD family hydrolase [Thermoplasmata archaeon]